MIHNLCRLTKIKIVTNIALGILAIGVTSHLAIAQNTDFEKVIENGKTVYKKKFKPIDNTLKTNQKVQVDMYFSLGCQKCVPAIMKILDFDTTFKRKNIDKKPQHKKKLLELTGNTKTPIIFINGKEIRSLSTSVIELELRKAGAKLKPTLKPKKLNASEQRLRQKS